MGEECGRIRSPVPGAGTAFRPGRQLLVWSIVRRRECAGAAPALMSTGFELITKLGVISVDDRPCVTSGRANVSGRRRYCQTTVESSSCR